MTSQITPEEFRSAAGVADWTAAPDGAVAQFATGDFVTGVDLILAIRDLAEAAQHHPDVDLRYPRVSVRLVTHDVGGLTAKDAALAAEISAAASRLGIPAE